MSEQKDENHFPLIKFIFLLIVVILIGSLFFISYFYDNKTVTFPNPGALHLSGIANKSGIIEDDKKDDLNGFEGLNYLLSKYGVLNPGGAFYPHRLNNITESDIKSIYRLMNDTDERVRLPAARMLSNSGPDAVPYLAQLLNSERDPIIRYKIFLALDCMDHDSARREIKSTQDRLIQENYSIKKLGKITGRHSYPSDGVPEMRTCADDISTLERYCTYNQNYDSNSEGRGRVTYEMELSEGQYYIFTVEAGSHDDIDHISCNRGYYVPCNVEHYGACASHEPGVVNVVADETLTNIDPIDWYFNYADKLHYVQTEDNSTLIKKNLAIINHSSDSEEIKIALETLSVIGNKDDSVLEAIVRLSRKTVGGTWSAENNVRIAVIHAFEKINSPHPDIINALIDLADPQKVGDEEWKDHQRAFALEVLGKMGASAKSKLPTILKMLSVENGDVKLAALRALAGIAPGDTKLLPFFRDHLKSTDAENRTIAIKALQIFGANFDEIMKMGFDSLNDPALIVREAAVDALTYKVPTDKINVSYLIEALNTSTEECNYRIHNLTADPESCRYKYCGPDEMTVLISCHALTLGKLAKSNEKIIMQLRNSIIKGPKTSSHNAIKGLDYAMQDWAVENKINTLDTLMAAVNDPDTRQTISNLLEKEKNKEQH